MNISITKTPIIQMTRAFLQQPNSATQKLAQLLNDNVTISDEAKELLAKMREDEAVEQQTKPRDAQKAAAFLDLAKQSLHDLANDIDTQLQNVDILQSDAATAEDKANALHNLSYLEKVANVRGGVFTSDLLQKVVGSNVTLDNAPSDLLETNAKSLGLTKLTEHAPTDMRERLLAAKEQLAQKIAAFDDVSIRVHDSTKMELKKEADAEVNIQALIEELLARMKEDL